MAVDQAFWEAVLRFCEAHDLLLIHDNPYLNQVMGVLIFAVGLQVVSLTSCVCVCEQGDVMREDV